jgi:hypothetical protein
MVYIFDNWYTYVFYTFQILDLSLVDDIIGKKSNSIKIWLEFMKSDILQVNFVRLN